MHRVGAGHAEVEKSLKAYQRTLADLIDTAAAAGRKTALFVFSDHGMTDVKKIVNLRAEVKKWGYRTGRDFMAFYDSTMARFWCHPKITAGLKDRLDGTGWGRVLPDAELESLGCRFDDNSYGEVIFLTSPGNLIVPSYMGREPVAAMHGYHPGDPDSHGCFMTNSDDCRLPVSILDVKDLIVEHVLAMETR
jgi:predicted AlkP superfamily pyrophosphatase or phosphodiesterase